MITTRCLLKHEDLTSLIGDSRDGKKDSLSRGGQEDFFSALGALIDCKDERCLIYEGKSKLIFIQSWGGGDQEAMSVGVAESQTTWWELEALLIY